MGFGPSLRLPKGRQLVAAVCYRIRRRGIEFLLVQTRGGRWIFPKGGVEPGLTRAQSAALEAFEEAGVHGRMEETAFARYLRRKTDPPAANSEKRPSSSRSSIRPEQPEFAVTAHLCEVFRLEPPQESNRNPTWFSAEKAKQRLVQGRPPEFGGELARVVDRAVARIRRLHGDSSHVPGHAKLGYARLGYTKLGYTRKDALQEVRFEASELAHAPGQVWSASYARYIRRERPDLQPSASRSAQPEIPDALLYRILRAVPPLGSTRPILQLGNGTGSLPETSQKVQFIDKVRPAKASAKSARKLRK
ncbi:MAG: NUDIX domain-containing protein [Terriglobales bacterium]|jgi:8-oxo-dGTP pyrophosphatase MutT (NUDIX family)